MNRKDMLLQILKEMVSATLGNDLDVKTDKHIQDLGFDSKVLLAFCDSLSTALNKDVHPGVFFEHPTLNSFADFLLERMPEPVERLLLNSAPSDRHNGSSPHNGNALHTNASNRNGLHGGALHDGGHSGNGQQLNGKPDVSDDLWREFDSEFSTADQFEKTANSAPAMDEMQHRQSNSGVPVIIGGGIAGMLISHQLSAKKIPHIILGSPEIGEVPKLGESMTEVVSIQFAKNFKHLSEYFFPKEFTPFYMGDLVAGLRFNFFESLASIFLDENIPKQFIHIDRLGFDRALYHEVKQMPECTWIEDRATEIEYSKDTDAITAIKLNSGQVIHPSFVWDCTNHIRLLGKKIGVPYQDLDRPREVIFTHYFQRGDKNVCNLHEEHPWMHATSLLRADEEFDQLTGVSWLIPLGKYVSVGISMLPEDIGGRTSEEIIALLTKAYARRGLEYSKVFPLRKEVVHVPSQHFVYERFFGKNWALVGGSGSSTWFTSGSNLSIATYMASIADKIIDETETYGGYFTNHVRGFLKTQKIYDSFMESSGSVDAIKFLSGVVEQARGRISSFFMSNPEVAKNNAQIAKSLWEEQVAIDRNYFEFLRQIATHARPDSRAQQTESVFKKFADLKAANSKIMLPYLRENEIRRQKPELFQQPAETRHDAAALQ